MAKKIMALVMAIALVVCFAVSASAEVNVVTTTKYVTVNGVQEIEVDVTVTATEEEFADGDNVTYYATDSDGKVHIDQVEVADGKAEFKFNVADGKLGSSVKVGYTDASGATDANIIGYTVTLDHNNQSKVIPTEDKTVTFTYTASADKQYKTVTTSTPGAEITSAELAGSTITVIFSSISSDVDLTLVEDDVVVESSATAEHIDSGAVLSTGKNDQILEGGEEDEKGNVLDGTLVDDESEATGARKITVMGKVSGLGEDAVYGVIITTGEIATGSMSATDFEDNYANYTYAGLTKASTGLFAVQVVDNSTENGFIVAGQNYNTAVYAQDANGNYTVTAGETVTIAAAEASN